MSDYVMPAVVVVLAALSFIILPYVIAACARERARSIRDAEAQAMKWERIALAARLEANRATDDAALLYQEVERLRALAGESDDQVVGVRQ